MKRDRYDALRGPFRGKTDSKVTFEQRMVVHPNGATTDHIPTSGRVLHEVTIRNVGRTHAHYSFRVSADEGLTYGDDAWVEISRHLDFDTDLGGEDNAVDELAKWLHHDGASHPQKHVVTAEFQHAPDSMAAYPRPREYRIKLSCS